MTKKDWAIAWRIALGVVMVFAITIGLEDSLKLVEDLGDVGKVAVALLFCYIVDLIAKGFIYEYQNKQSL